MVRDINSYITTIKNQIEKNHDEILSLSHEIHDNPEIGNQEVKACKWLTDLLIKHGFEVKVNIATHPTGFIARKKGQNKGPVIGLLAEYDALKGLGHACGHNIIAMTSVAAGIALAQIIDQTGGEIVVFGTPAEEGGPHGNATASYVAANLFEGVDVCMMIHPFHTTAKTQPTLAIVPIEFEFFGKASHAASAPEQGVNALDAMILFYNGVNALRQQSPRDVLYHGIITHGGEAPNIIPDYTKASFYIRAAHHETCLIYKEKILHIGKGCAEATGCEFKYNDDFNQVHEMLICDRFEQLFIEEAKRLGLEVKLEGAKSIGSTDAGNVSQVVPTIHPTLKICDESITIHTQHFKEAAISKVGDQAILDGALILASIGLRLLTEESLLNEIKNEFEQLKSLKSLVN
ncbi:MAG: M20 family metallopeptidase [Turicibacter sanguinis]